MERIERLVAITLLLQSRGKMTAGRLAEILGVSIRTIYRDITALSLAHVPIVMDYGPGGGYYLPDTYHLDPSTFTREEAVSLILSADIVGMHSFFASDNDLQRALFKLEATLPENYRADISWAREHILFDTEAWSARTSAASSPIYLDTIRAAMLESRTLDVLYPCYQMEGVKRPAMGVLPASVSGPTGEMVRAGVTAVAAEVGHEAEEKIGLLSGLEWLRVEPYGLIFKAVSRLHMRVGIWYLVAYSPASEQFRAFRVGSIEDMRRCEEHFANRANFDLHAYWKEAQRHLEQQISSLTLVLRVMPSARHKLHGDVTLLDEEVDGSILVEVSLESAEDAIAYVLALGPAVTVIEPERVRSAVVEAVKAIAALYG